MIPAGSLLPVCDCYRPPATSSHLLSPCVLTGTSQCCCLRCAGSAGPACLCCSSRPGSRHAQPRSRPGPRGWTLALGEAGARPRSARAARPSRPRGFLPFRFGEVLQALRGSPRFAYLFFESKSDTGLLTRCSGRAGAASAVEPRALEGLRVACAPRVFRPDHPS